MDPEVFFDLGDYTVTFHVLHGRGQQSGADVATPAAHLCRWKDGLIIYFKSKGGYKVQHLEMSGEEASGGIEAPVR